VLGLHDHLAGRVEQRGRAVAALLDVRRVRRAHEDRAHLLAARPRRRAGRPTCRRERVEAAGAHAALEHDRARVVGARPASPRDEDGGLRAGDDAPGRDVRRAGLGRRSTARDRASRRSRIVTTSIVGAGVAVAVALLVLGLERLAHRRGSGADARTVSSKDWPR
jgi:hypothetical protein